MTKYQNNKDWFSKMKDIKRDMISHNEKPNIIFETPKVYKDGVAYKGKDGNSPIWYKWNLFTTKTSKNGKSFKSQKIVIKSNYGLFRILYKYAIMLKAIGSSKYNTYYCICNFIYNNTLIGKGRFMCNNKNNEIVVRIVKFVYKNEYKVDESLVDQRSFCIEEDIKNKRSVVTTIKNKNKGDETFGKFIELYNDCKNTSILAVKMKLSRREINNLVKRYKEEKL